MQKALGQIKTQEQTCQKARMYTSPCSQRGQHWFSLSAGSWLEAAYSCPPHAGSTLTSTVMRCLPEREQVHVTVLAAWAALVLPGCRRAGSWQEGAHAAPWVRRARDDGGRILALLQQERPPALRAHSVRSCVEPGAEVKEGTACWARWAAPAASALGSMFPLGPHWGQPRLALLHQE